MGKNCWVWSTHNERAHNESAIYLDSDQAGVTGTQALPTSKIRIKLSDMCPLVLHVLQQASCCLSEGTSNSYFENNIPVFLEKLLCYTCTTHDLFALYKQM